MSKLKIIQFHHGSSEENKQDYPLLNRSKYKFEGQKEVNFRKNSLRKQLASSFNFFFGRKDYSKNSLRAELVPFRKFAGCILRKENTFKKTWNLAKVIFGWKLGKSKLNSYPVGMILCPGNLCNLGCEFCPVGVNDEGRVRGYLSFENFKKIIDECGPYLYDLHLYNWGEPFINKDIFKMIKYAKKYKIRITISTNLGIFNDRIANNIIESEIDLLTISLDGASNETVEKYQTKNDFEKVLKNMIHLTKLKKELKKDKPVIQWLFVVHRHNEHEIEKARKLCEENGINNFRLAKMTPDMGNLLFKSAEEQFDELKDWLPKDERLSSFNYKTKQYRDYRAKCNLLWLGPTVNWNGAVSPCCVVWNEKQDFGNCVETSFKEVWNNEKFQNARKNIVDKKGAKPDICRICKVKNAQNFNLY